MRLRTLLLLSLLFSLLQGPFLPPVFFEGLLLVLILSSGNAGIAGNANKVMMQLFFSGLIFDLVQSTELGTTSAIFIAVGLLVSLFREAIPFQRPTFAAILSFAVLLVRGKILFTNFFLTEALVSGVIVFLFLNYISRPARDNRLEIR